MKFLQGNIRAQLLTAVTVVLVGVVGFQLWSMFWAASPGSDTSLRWFVCTETRKPFQKRIELGMSVPVMSPHSGKETGYVAELCFWNKDGTSREKDPTPVLLGCYVGETGPTFCPECGRLVIGHNPGPDAARKPPTKEEWEARRTQTLSR